MTPISTDELERIFARAIIMLHKYGIEEIKIPGDDSWYQKIWHQDRTWEKTPTITMGEVYEDIQGLKDTVKEDIMIPYDLERLGALLTIIGAVMSEHKL